MRAAGRRSSTSTARPAASTPTPCCSTTRRRAPGGRAPDRRGHRRIACVADRTEVYTARERVAGYEAALAAAGIAVDPELIRPGSPDAPHAEGIVAELLALPPDRRPTAVFSANNRNTVGALHALAGRAARSRWSASTTSSSPTCSASRRPRRRRPARRQAASLASPGSTATSARRSA